MFNKELSTKAEEMHWSSAKEARLKNEKKTFDVDQNEQIWEFMIRKLSRIQTSKR